MRLAHFRWERGSLSSEAPVFVENVAPSQAVRLALKRNARLGVTDSSSFAQNVPHYHAKRWFGHPRFVRVKCGSLSLSLSLSLSSEIMALR